MRSSGLLRSQGFRLWSFNPRTTSAGLQNRKEWVDPMLAVQVFSGS